MKQHRPLSHRALCIFWTAILLGTAALTLLSLGYQTRAQALRESERYHALNPTEIVIQGGNDLHDGSTATDWLLSANEDAVLFGYYHKGILGYERIFTVALDYDGDAPYCANIFGIYSGGDVDFHLFGAVTDPTITEMRITTDSRYGDTYEPDTYTLYTRDMVYQNGIYYFVLPVSPTKNPYTDTYTLNPYIAKVCLIGRSNTQQEYTFDKPKDLPPEFLKAMGS